MIERLSIELTDLCGKGCAFCYNGSGPTGETRWTVDELAAFVRDCAAHGTRAVSFGGGEPLQFPGLCALLRRLDGVVFRSLTSNGLLLRGRLLEELVAARPDKVHLSIHFPDDADEVARVIAQVHALASLGLASGVNLLVARSRLEAAQAAAASLRAAGIGPERVVLLPMRGADTPTADELGRVAGGPRFQSMSCLMGCASSPRFASIGHDRTVAWCSYTRARRPLVAPTARALALALDGLGLTFCGGAP